MIGISTRLGDLQIVHTILQINPTVPCRVHARRRATPGIDVRLPVMSRIARVSLISPPLRIIWGYVHVGDAEALAGYARLVRGTNGFNAFVDQAVG